MHPAMGMGECEVINKQQPHGICIFSDMAHVLIIGLKQNLLPSQWRQFNNYTKCIKTLRLSELWLKHNHCVLAILQMHTRGSSVTTLEILEPKYHQFLDLWLCS